MKLSGKLFLIASSLFLLTILLVTLGCGSSGGGGGDSATTSTSAQASTTSTTTTTTTTFPLPQTATFEATAVEEEEVTIGSTTVSREVITNKIIVSLASGQTESNLSSSLPSGYSVLGSNSLTGVYEIGVPAGTSVSNAMSTIQDLSTVSTAGADYVINNYFTPNDYAFENNLAWGHTSVSIESVWDITTGDANVVVCITDGGIDYGINGTESTVYNNDFSASRIHDSSWDFVNSDAKPDDEIGHGTAVAGIAVAEGNNSHKIAGMNWVSPIWVNKVTGFNQKGSTTALANAVSYAAMNGCKVINTSVGVVLDPSSDADWQLIEALAEAADVCYANNAIWVCAAGNENVEVSGSTSSPQVYPAALATLTNSPVIAVGAYDQSEDRWTSGNEGSNYGDAIEICAPGESIYTTQYGNSTQTEGRTSLAAPFVAGVASLLYSIGEDINASPAPSLVKEALINGGDTISTDQNIGKKLNARGAVLNFISNYDKALLSVSCNVAGANITVEGTDIGKVTTDEGYTRAIVDSYSTLPTISVSKPGYETYTVLASLVSGYERTINATLTASVSTTTTTTTTSTTSTSTTTTSTTSTTGAAADVTISGNPSSSLTLDNGNIWIKVNAAASNEYYIHEAGFSGEDSWLGGAGLHSALCLSGAEPFSDGTRNRSIGTWTDLGTVAAYSVTYEVYYDAEEITCRWVFVMPAGKDYVLWQSKFENSGSGAVHINNPNSYSHQDIYFWYYLKPASTAEVYCGYPADESIGWGSWGSSATWSLLPVSKDFMTIYDSSRAMTFGFLEPYPTVSGPNMFAAWSNSGIEAQTSNMYINEGAIKYWYGFYGFHTGSYEAGEAMYDDAEATIDSYNFLFTE